MLVNLDRKQTSKRRRTPKRTPKRKRTLKRKRTPKRKRTTKRTPKRLRGGDKLSGSESECSLNMNPMNTTGQKMTDKDCVLLITIHGGISPDLEKIDPKDNKYKTIDTDWDPTIDIGTLDISDEVKVNKLNIAGPHVSNFTSAEIMRKYADSLGELMGFTCKGPYWFKSNPTGAKVNIKPKLDTMNEFNLEDFKNRVKQFQPRERHWNDIHWWTRFRLGHKLSLKTQDALHEYLEQAESAYRMYDINSETETINKSFFLSSDVVKKNRTTCCDYHWDMMIFDDKGNGTSIIDDMMEKGYSDAELAKDSTFKTTLEKIINYTHIELGKTNIKMIDATCNNISGFNDEKYKTSEEYHKNESNRLKQRETIKDLNLAYGGK